MSYTIESQMIDCELWIKAGDHQRVIERTQRELQDAERALVEMRAKLSAAWREADYWRGQHAKVLEQMTKRAEDDWK